MNKIKHWFNALSRQEKIMMLFIILLLIGIITRWGFIKTQTAEKFRDRFRFSIEKPDTVKQDNIVDQTSKDDK